jgi:hypothetical protein
MTLFNGKLSAIDRSYCRVSGGHGPRLRVPGAGRRVEELATTGITRLIETLAAEQKNSAPEIYAGISAAVDAIRVAGAQTDDIRLVAIKCSSTKNTIRFQ